MNFEALFASFGIVAIAEIGDKTQLLSFVLAARFRGRHWAIIAGIFVATIFNHLFAAAIGDWVAAQLGPVWLRWLLGLAFLAFAVWALIPDRLDDEPEGPSGRGAFLTTTLLFFLAEMGDKTQVATAMLVANYSAFVAVIMGTTLGMMIANVPAVYLGGGAAQRLPLKLIRLIAAGTFVLLGIVTLSGAV